MFLSPVLQFALLPLCWHKGRQLIFNLDHFNVALLNRSCENDWGTEEQDGGSPAGFAAIASHVTILSELTQTSIDISSVKSVKNYFHTEIQTQLLVRCSRKYQVTIMQCTLCTVHVITHVSITVFFLHHFSVAHMVLFRENLLPIKQHNSVFHQACNIPWRSLFSSLLFIIIFGVVTNTTICFWSKSNMFSMNNAMDPTQATSKMTYLIR